MAKCKQCNVTISDDTTVCPLCQCVVEVGEPATNHKIGVRRCDDWDMQFEQQAWSMPKLNEYPDVWVKERKIKHFCNLILVAVLGASAVLAVVNFAFSRDSWWCVIPMAAMLYGYLAFRSIFVSRKGYRWKVFVSVAFALLLILVIDIETGFYRWSLNYVFPGGILIMDLVVAILMMTNIQNWHSYMIMQIVMAVVSLIPITLWSFGIITSPLLSVIAIVVSGFMFLGSLIIGDRTARSELRRRFHIR